MYKILFYYNMKFAIKIIFTQKKLAIVYVNFVV
jgi:hypothetical protein